MHTLFCLWLTLALGSNLRSGIRAVDCSGKNVHHDECWLLLPLRPLRLNTRPRALLFIWCSWDKTCLGIVGGDKAVPPALYPWHTYCVLATLFVLLLPATWGWGELLTAYGTLFPGEMKTEWKYWSGKGEVKGFVSVIFWRKMLMRCSTPSLCVHRQEGSSPFRVRQPWEKGGSYGTYTSLTETSILCTVPRWSRAPNSVPFLSLVVSQAAVIKNCGQILFFLTAVRWWWPRSFGSLRKATVLSSPCLGADNSLDKLWLLFTSKSPLSCLCACKHTTL